MQFVTTNSKTLVLSYKKNRFRSITQLERKALWNMRQKLIFRCSHVYDVMHVASFLIPIWGVDTYFSCCDDLCVCVQMCVLAAPGKYISIHLTSLLAFWLPSLLPCCFLDISNTGLATASWPECEGSAFSITLEI